MNKVLVTGTGRCGTTFLMRLFTYLNLNTGIDPKDIQKYVFNKCNSGIELNGNDPKNESIRFIKSPTFSRHISNLVTEKKWKIDFVIVPIRKYEEAARSREHFKKNAGGLTWGATDYASQLDEFYKSISILIRETTLHDIKTIFLDFEKMTSNKEYVYEKLKPVLSNIDFTSFCKAYEKADSDSKIKSGMWKKNK